MSSSTAGAGGVVGELAYRLRGIRLRRPEPSGRAVVVSVICLFLLIVLASPLQTYLNRRAAVASSLKQQAQLRSQVTELQKQKALWNDPAYVQRQARARLRYVRPGDTLYTVIGGQSDTGSSSAGEAKAAVVSKLPSWNAALWSSVLDASSAK